MGEVGILKRSDRVELIRGEIVKLLVVRLAGRAIVSVQMPIVLADDTEPELDLAVYRRRTPPYKEREAHADDALLLIEVAEAGILEVHRTPDAEGYRDASRVAGAATVALQAFLTLL